MWKFDEKLQLNSICGQMEFSWKSNFNKTKSEKYLQQITSAAAEAILQTEQSRWLWKCIGKKKAIRNSQDRKKKKIIKEPKGAKL